MCMCGCVTCVHVYICVHVCVHVCVCVFNCLICLDIHIFTGQRSVQCAQAVSMAEHKQARVQ